MNCVYNYCVPWFFYASIPFPPIYNQSIPIYLSIGIGNQYQSITTRIFAIDWSSIININRLIDIDWYRLISIVIDYRFHRLDTPGCHANIKFISSSQRVVFFLLYGETSSTKAKGGNRDAIELYDTHKGDIRKIRLSGPG